MAEPHWVESLYPAHFGYKDYDELTKPIEEVRTMLDKLLDKLSTVNTESIRDIYINVLAMVTAQERTSTAPITRMVDISTQTQLSALMTKSLSVKTDGSGSGDGKGLWTSMEHELLRDHYMREHDEYLATRAELDMMKSDEHKLESECKQAKLELVKRSDELLTKDADVNRLRAVNSSLREEMVSIMRQLTESETDLRELKAQYKLKSTEHQQASAELNDLAIKYKLIQVKLDRVHDEAGVEADRSIAAIKLKCDQEVADLTDRINNLTEILDVERELHERCKQGLEVLRLHFSQSSIVQALVDTG